MGRNDLPPQDTLDFQEKLRILYDLNLELSRSGSFDDLCRSAVQLGHERLGFDRLGLWLLDTDPDFVHGTFGIDDAGKIQDQRDLRVRGWMGEALTLDVADTRAFRLETPFYADQDQVTGRGEHITGIIWDGEHRLGWLSADNYIPHAHIADYQVELLGLYGSIIGNLVTRKRTEEELRAREADAHQFQAKLRTLHDVTIELSKIRSFDDLCQRAVKLGRERMGFDRLGLWFLDSDPNYMVGSFGTDEHGNVRDERQKRIATTFGKGLETYEDRVLVSIESNNPLFDDNRNVIGYGWIAAAKVWDGDRNIGWLSTDNYFTQQPRSNFVLELLALYAATLGHLASIRKSEDALAAERNLLRVVIDTVPDLIFVKDTSGRFVMGNRALWESIPGLTSEQDLIGKADYDFGPHDLADQYAADDQKVLTTGMALTNIDEPGDLQKPAFQFMLTSKSPLKDERGQIIGLVGVAHDLTSHKRAEAALRQSEERFRLISSLTSDYTFSSRFNAQGVLENIFLTGAFEEISGYTPQEFIALGGWRATLHPDDLDQDDRDMDRLRSDQRVTSEVRIIKKDGSVRWVRSYAHSIRDTTQTQLIGVNGAVQDITERKQAEDRVRRSEANLRALLDATTDVSFLITPTGAFLTLNKVIAESRGLTVEQLVGQNAFEVLPPPIRAERQKRFEEAIRTGQPLRWEDSGTSGWWDNSIYPVLSPTGAVEAFAVYSREITLQKNLAFDLQRYTTQLEQMVEEQTAQLRRAKEQIEIILNNTSDAVAFTHLNGDIQTRNPAFAAMFGDQVSQFIEHILWTITNDAQCNAMGTALLQVILDGESRRIEAQILSEDGHDRDIDLTFIPVRSANDTEQQGILVTAHDITYYKEIERFKARFVADALHDLATPISGLRTRLYLLKRSPEKLEAHVLALENQVQHLHNLLSDLRTLSQHDRSKPIMNAELGDLNQVVMRVFDTYEPVAIDKAQTITISVDPALQKFHFDSQQLERVFVNLVSNAINYTPNGNAVSVQTRLERAHVIFSVSDEGIGIDAEELPHVFDRFYRTDHARRLQASGTGLGLAIVKEIVELHGGTVTVASELGQGSTFIVRLPYK